MPWDKTREDRRRDTQNYSSPEYKRNRPIAMRRDKWRCQIGYPGICIGAASMCDHKTPITQGGSHGLDNLQAACKPCHAKKTAEEGGGYRSKPSQDPQPRPRTAW